MDGFVVEVGGQGVFNTVDSEESDQTGVRVLGENPIFCDMLDCSPKQRSDLVLLKILVPILNQNKITMMDVNCPCTFYL